MPDTFTPNLNLTQPEVGASDDTWGNKLNDDLDIVDALFAATGTGTVIRRDANDDADVGGVNVHKAAGNARKVKFKSTASTRWELYTDATAESGSNAGSLFKLDRFNDAGSLLGTALSINRATGVATLEATPLVGANSIWHAGNDGAGSTLDADLLDGLQGSAYEQLTNKNAANGYAGLDSAGQIVATLVPLKQQPITAGFRNLRIIPNAGTPNTHIDVDADVVTVETTGNLAYRLQGINLTINCTTTGANALDAGGLANNTWYSVWVIYNPGTDTIAGLASTSATSPTMPSGYTAKARFGWMRTNASAQFRSTFQQGRRVHYTSNVPQTMSSGAVGTYSLTSPTLSAIATGNFVPPTAVEIRVCTTGCLAGAASANFLGAPRDMGGTNNGPTGSNGIIWPIAYAGGATFAHTGQVQDLMLESTNIYWCSSAAGGAISCLGWEDNIQ